MNKDVDWYEMQKSGKTLHEATVAMHHHSQMIEELEGLLSAAKISRRDNALIGNIESSLERSKRNRESWYDVVESCLRHLAGNWFLLDTRKKTAD